MDRIIEVKVGGNYLSKDNKNAGVRGEGNVTKLRITFDEGWDSYAKTVTFWDAYGNNPVKRIQGIDLIEDITKDTRTYITPIPKEPLAIAGELTFVIDGYLDGKRQRSISDKLVVKDAPITDNAGEPTDPTPTQAEQLQVQIDKFKGDVQAAVIARNETKAYRDETEGFSQKAAKDATNAEENAKIAVKKASEAEQSATKAKEAVGKTNYIGENGNWYAWDSSISAFYDTGIKAQAGSTVYLGDNPPPEADVWIDANGDTNCGDVFGDYSTNQAISPFSFAGGHDNLSGARAFTVIEVDGANNVYVLDGIDGLEVGDVYSVHFYNQRENYGKITAIDAETNRVTVDVIFDEGLNTRNIPVEEDGFDNEKNTFRIIAKPYVGTRKIGCATMNFGYENKALSKGAGNIGYFNTSYGSYSFCGGMQNRAGYCSASFGRQVYTLGYMCFGAGKYLWLKKDGQIGFGQYNIIDDDGKWLFVIGNGTAENSRSNAMSVDFDGNVTFNGDIYAKNGEEKVFTDKNVIPLATELLKNNDIKKLAKDIILGNIVGSFAVNPLIEGVTGAFSVSLDFPIIYDTYEVIVNGEDISGDINEGDSFVSAPLIFKGDNVKVVFKKAGATILKTKVSQAKDAGNIIYGRLEIVDE